MKKLYFILLLSVFVSFGMAAIAAQQVWIKPEEPAVAPPPDEAPDIPESVEPRVHRQEQKKPEQGTPIDAASANTFYENCAAQQHPLLKGETLELFCSCTAVKMMENMTAEQVATMGKATQSGRHQRHRMLMFVYAPCIEYPARALIEDQCMTQAATMKHPDKTCACVAKGVGEYMSVHAPSVIQRTIKANPVDAEIDPMRSLLESPEFENQTRYFMTNCVAKHEFGQ